MKAEIEKQPTKTEEAAVEPCKQVIKKMKLKKASLGPWPIRLPPGRVEPPFPALPSFASSATILSYVEYDDKVNDLLMSLSKNTRKYALQHKNQLEGFVEDCPPLAK